MTISPFDIFYAEKENEFKTKRHYYLCIYVQSLDDNNNLRNDVYGLIITSNNKYEFLTHDDYNVPIELNGKKSYICCDKMVRMVIDNKMYKKNMKIPLYKRKQIIHKMQIFSNEMYRQLKKVDLL